MLDDLCQDLSKTMDQSTDRSSSGTAPIIKSFYDLFSRQCEETESTNSVREAKGYIPPAKSAGKRIHYFFN